MQPRFDREHRLRRWVALVYALSSSVVLGAAEGQEVASPPAPIQVSTNFESGSMGKVDFVAPTDLRLHVAGQADAAGRNHQATWYYFRLDGVRGRDLTLHLTDLVGEYNFRPGACAMNPDTVPVFSIDGRNWQHFPSMLWDDQRKEATLHLSGTNDPVWVAHVPPYPLNRLRHLLEELRRTPAAQVETIGRSVEGRDLNLVTVTSPSHAQAGKRQVWLLARQHAWEAGTSYVLEGALRFLISDDPQAQQLRERVVFRLVPTMDPDGLVEGHVRFNALGYDLNRHWPEVDLANAETRTRMPEISAVKQALFAKLEAGEHIDVLLNLHNTETAEYLDTQVDDPAIQKSFRAFQAGLKNATSFDPSADLAVRKDPADTTNSLWTERKVPALLLEQRIGSSRKLGRRPTVADRLEFGRGLVNELARVVLERDTPKAP